MATDTETRSAQLATEINRLAAAREEMHRQHAADVEALTALHLDGSPETDGGLFHRAIGALRREAQILDAQYQSEIAALVSEHNALNAAALDAPTHEPPMTTIDDVISKLRASSSAPRLISETAEPSAEACEFLASAIEGFDEGAYPDTARRMRAEWWTMALRSGQATIQDAEDYLRS